MKNTDIILGAKTGSQDAPPTNALTMRLEPQAPSCAHSFSLTCSFCPETASMGGVGEHPPYFTGWWRWISLGREVNRSQVFYFLRKCLADALVCEGEMAASSSSPISKETSCCNIGVWMCTQNTCLLQPPGPRQRAPFPIRLRHELLSPGPVGRQDTKHLEKSGNGHQWSSGTQALSCVGSLVTSEVHCAC